MLHSTPPPHPASLTKVAILAYWVDGFGAQILTRTRPVSLVWGGFIDGQCPCRGSRAAGFRRARSGRLRARQV